MSRAIAVLGAPGAGATTTAVQLAAKLAESNATTVLLVLCDAVLPPKGYLLADTRAESIGGQLVQAGALGDKELLRAVVPVNDYFGLMGYNVGDNKTTYPAPTKGGCEKWCRALAAQADVILYDLGSRGDTLLAETVLEIADTVVSVLGAEVKSAAWYRHTGKGLDTDIQIINRAAKGQPVEVFEGAIGTFFSLPYSLELERNFETLRLLEPVKDSRYTAALQEVVEKL